jgi:hypothetical protein
MRPLSLKYRNVYDARFLAIQVTDSLRSARAVAQIACQLFGLKRVVYVGCGQGAWLAAFAELGVNEIRGVDGDYVNRDNLLFDSANFTAVDLSRAEPSIQNFGALRFGDMRRSSRAFTGQ